jgi:hypothetical protein
MKKAETKQFNIGVENIQLYHQLGASLATTASINGIFNPWSNIAKGTARYNRIGDRIHPLGMKVKLYIANKTDRPNTMVRVIVAILPKTHAGLLGVQTITTANFDPFEGTQDLGNVQNILCLDPDVDKGVRFLYDKVHRLLPIGATFTPKEQTKLIRLSIKRKSRDIVFDSDAQTITNNPLAFYVIPYEQYSTVTTDNVTSCAAQMTLFIRMFEAVASSSLNKWNILTYVSNRLSVVASEREG